MRASVIVLVLCVPAAVLAADEPELAKVINVEALNTKADEIDPHVAANNRALLYASNAGGKFAIYVSYRPAAAWGKGTPMPGSDDPDEDRRSPFLFNTTLYFATNHVPDERLKDLKNFDIKFTTQGRAPLPLLGISAKEDELHPWIHAGKEFYFSRATDAGWMQFVANGPVPGPIGGAKPVGFPAGFHGATISADGRTMYLEGPLDEQRTRIFVSRRERIGAAWSAPAAISNLSAADSAHSDAGAALSPDGRYLYFASNRAGGKGGWDIYAVSVPSLATAEK